jgi:acyl-coenzyme A synthetase/AMP-(fatty) acid ligase
VVVDRLPKTRSGKILRGTMRQIADGRRPASRTRRYARTGTDRTHP